MALTNDRERRICAKYSKPDENRNVHCYECPLVKFNDDLLCKANSHYDRHLGYWVPDEYDEQPYQRL